MGGVVVQVSWLPFKSLDRRICFVYKHLNEFFYAIIFNIFILFYFFGDSVM